MVVTPFPVYWLGASFHGLQITEASHDPGGAFSIQYGNCLQGGQATCVTPLRIVTSPNNSFVPGGAAPGRVLSVRGVDARFAQAGRTIVIPTGPVVVAIFASDARVARAAAQTAVPINEVGFPGELLPPPFADTGFASKPLPDQSPCRCGRCTRRCGAVRKRRRGRGPYGDSHPGERAEAPVIIGAAHIPDPRRAPAVDPLGAGVDRALGDRPQEARGVREPHRGLAVLQHGERVASDAIDSAIDA